MYVCVFREHKVEEVQTIIYSGLSVSLWRYSNFLCVLKTLYDFGGREGRKKKLEIKKEKKN